MIVKFQLGERKECRWAYHDTRKIQISYNASKKDWLGKALMYSKNDEANLVLITHADGDGQHIFYEAGYILSDTGSTVSHI